MSATEAATSAVAHGEVRMLIDGELVEAASGKRFDNFNPATEERLGDVADAGPEDMQRAITAARRAFDESDWARNHEFRKRAMLQLAEALATEREEFRAEIVAEVGCPVGATAPQVDSPLANALQWPAGMIEVHPVVVRPQRQHDARAGLAQGHARADRCGRRDHAVELPAVADPAQDRARARHRVHRGAEARARHAVERDAHRPHRGREDRPAAGCAQRGDLVGSARR